jgi:mercuric reductase
MRQTDFVIIGGGAAAFAAAIRASELEKATIMINDGLPLGGTCVNVGCVPSKMLLHAGEVMNRSTTHGIPGLDLEVKGFSFREIVLDELRLVEHMRQDKYEKVLATLKGVKHLAGHAKFIDDHTVEVNGEKIRGKKILIATGSTAYGPPVPGLDETGFITHIGALRIERRPESLIVIGGGPLGLEFGQMYARFGTKVTLLEYGDRLMMPAEPELSERLREILTSEGIEVFTGVRLREAKRGGFGKTLVFERSGARREVTAEEILIAAGKTPNTDGLGLERAGVVTNARKAVVVGPDYSTSVPHIYAAGDVADLPLRFETTAGKEGTYAAGNALLGERKSIDYGSVPWTVFTDPELAGVGLTDAEAVKKGIACACRTIEFDKVPKALIVKDTRGLIKMVIDEKSRRILGIHILAPRAGDIIATAMMVVRNGMTVDDVIETIPMFPTMSEAIKIAAQSFDRDVGVLSCCT